MKVLGILFFILQISFTTLSAAEWQWSVKVKDYISTETNANPNAFLWIPEDCLHIKAVVVGQHNMCEETIFEHPAFRENLSDLGVAIIWITPGIDYAWDVTNGCQSYFDEMIKDLAEVSGYFELEYIPIIPLGHSAMATFPWNFAAWNPERTLAIISYCGDAPRTNLTGYGGNNLEWGRTRNIDGIPGLMIQGEYEWWEARVNPALAFKMMYPESCISFLCDVGHGHFDVSDEVVSYIAMFIRKAVMYRLPQKQPLNQSVDLIKLDNKKGWLAEKWSPVYEKRSEALPYIKYEGDKHDAFWYFDEDMAKLTEKYYATAKGKKNQFIGIKQRGELLTFDEKSHAGYNVEFIPYKDGMTFNLSGIFSDSLHKSAMKDKRIEQIKIDRICGPVKKINDTTFTVRFYRMGLDNSKRTGDIWLLAHHRGDDLYKSAVQQLNIRIPYPIQQGEKQTITFDSIRNIGLETKTVLLNAKSDSGLPVYYYVKEGPAKIINNKLSIQKIPPRAKYPLKITVVAWQYGLKSEYKTAKAVERSFYIEK
ncbi:MAG: hypothetical protein GX963_02080 [Bacteroidales bacterium]|nr:hypothetical protein [Bacteroidales bacterium]